MDQTYFDQIIIDFFPQKNKQGYFDRKFKESDCNLMDFGIFLTKSWNNFNTFLKIPGCYKSILTAKDGTRSCYIGPREGNPSQQQNILDKLGHLPFKAIKTTDIPCGSFMFLGEITMNMSNDLDNEFIDFYKSLIYPLIPELEFPFTKRSEIPYDLETVAPIFEFPQESNETMGVTLKNYFINDETYDKFINKLIEKGYCHPTTKLWNDFGPSKGLIVAIIKGLQPLGYYKNHKRPSNKQIKEIALNTFGWDIGIDTIKSTKPKDGDLRFLPSAAEI